MMRSQSANGIGCAPSSPAAYAAHRLHDVADERAVLRPVGDESRRLVAAPDDDVGRGLDLRHLVAVDHLLVAGEVEHLRAGARETPARSKTAPRCPGRRRRAPPSRPARFPSAFPVGPISTTGSPGCSCAQRSEEPPISSTMVDTSPRSRSTHAPVSASPSITSRVPARDRRERLVVLQPVELAGLETLGRGAARGRPLRRSSA